MALQKVENIPVQLVGLVAIKCHIKIKSIAGNKDGFVATVVFTKDTPDGEFIKIKDYCFTPSMEGKNFIAQAYENLKTLPEFAGATDC